MSARRTTIFRAVGITVASLGLAVPSARAANPLLSGYGGPGQGAQVIIGGGLVNPPGGGSAPSASTASELTVGPAEASSHGGSASSHRSPQHRPKASGAGAGQGSSATAKADNRPVLGRTAADDLSSSSSGAALGLSGGDALLVAFVLAALTATALVTRRLTRRTP